MPEKSTEISVKKTNITNKTFGDIARYVSIILGFIGAGFGGGLYFGSDKFDIEKNELKKENEELQVSIERQKSLLRADSVDKQNWLRQNTHHFLFNSLEEDLLTLSVSNVTINPCTAGPATGCWGKIATARVGDIVSMHIYYHNTGDIPVNDVSIGFTKEYSSRTYVGYGGIFVGNELIKVGTVSVYLQFPATRLTFIPGSVRWYKNQIYQPQIVNDSALISASHFKLGTVDPDWESQGALVFDFNVEK